MLKMYMMYPEDMGDLSGRRLAADGDGAGDSHGAADSDGDGDADLASASDGDGDGDMDGDADSDVTVPAHIDDFADVGGLPNDADDEDLSPTQHYSPLHLPKPDSMPILAPTTPPATGLPSGLLKYFFMI